MVQALSELDISTRIGDEYIGHISSNSRLHSVLVPQLLVDK